MIDTFFDKKTPGSIARFGKRAGHSYSGNSRYHLNSVSPDASGLTAKSIADRLRAHEPETDIVVPVVRPVVVTVNRPDINGIIVPAPAANHAVRPRGRARATHYYGNCVIAQGSDGL